MVRYLFYTIGDLTYQSPLVECKESRLMSVLLYPPSLKKKNNLTPLDSSTASSEQ